MCDIKDDLKSCDTCNHEYEPKPTPGQVWVGKGTETYCVLGARRYDCDARLAESCCSCESKLAKAWDVGHGMGCIKGAEDERCYTEQWKNENPKPKPAMGMVGWLHSPDRLLWGRAADGISCGGEDINDYRMLCERIINNYRKLNKGRVIT